MDRKLSKNMKGSVVVESKMFHLPDGNILLLTRLQTQSKVSSMNNPQSQKQIPFPGEPLPSFAGCHTRRASISPHKRCQLCRCPILEKDGDFVYCAGCISDKTHSVQNVLRRKGYDSVRRYE